MKIKACKNHTRIIINGSWWRVLNEDWTEESSYLSSVEHLCTIQGADPDIGPTKQWNYVYKEETAFTCKACKTKAPARVRAYIRLLNQQVPVEMGSVLETLQKQMREIGFPGVTNIGQNYTYPGNTYPGNTTTNVTGITQFPNSNTIIPQSTTTLDTLLNHRYTQEYTKTLQDLEYKQQQQQLWFNTNNTTDGK